MHTFFIPVEQLKECLCDMDAIKLGAFLSTLAAGYKVASSLSAESDIAVI